MYDPVAEAAANNAFRNNLQAQANYGAALPKAQVGTNPTPAAIPASAGGGDFVHNAPIMVTMGGGDHTPAANAGIHTGLFPSGMFAPDTTSQNPTQSTGGSLVSRINASFKASNWFQKVLGTVFLLTLLFTMSVPAIAQPAPIGPMGNLTFSQLNTAADTIALVPQQMVGLLVGTPTAGATYTTPTATALCALFPFVSASQAPSFSWLFVVKNTSAGANTITMAGGTGVTLSGTGTAAQNTVRLFMIEIRGCGGTPAANLYSLTTGAF